MNLLERVSIDDIINYAIAVAKGKLTLNDAVKTFGKDYGLFLSLYKNIEKLYVNTKLTITDDASNAIHYYNNMQEAIRAINTEMAWAAIEQFEENGGHQVTKKISTIGPYKLNKITTTVVEGDHWKYYWDAIQYWRYDQRYKVHYHAVKYNLDKSRFHDSYIELYQYNNMLTDLLIEEALSDIEHNIAGQAFLIVLNDLIGDLF